MDGMQDTHKTVASPFVHFLVSKLSVLLSFPVNAKVVCKALRKHVGLLGFIVKLRNKYTRNSPDVLRREFFRYSRIANSGTCNNVPDKDTLSFYTWHFVEGGGRLIKLFSNEFAAWSDKTRFSYFNFSSVCPAQVFFLTGVLFST